MRQGLGTVNCCANCAHCLVDVDYTDTSSYYCTLDAKPMPTEYKEFGIGTDKALQEWGQWVEENEVFPNNMCGKYTKVGDYDCIG